MDEEGLTGSGGEEEELTSAQQEAASPPCEEKATATPAMGNEDMLAAITPMMEQQALQVQAQLSQQGVRLAQQVQAQLSQQGDQQAQRFRHSCPSMQRHLPSTHRHWWKPSRFRASVM